ncbi:hypothetical protein [Aliiglaciecola litoralis]|uniref:Sulfotransferase family protein n=1 Tax=Aliiglaciecola litoralis TaxID=582857 RepID=A0ABP3WXI8_9ALTE
MKKLILHVGLHKTGSTSIQQSLFQNKHKLREQEWHLFNYAPNGASEPTGNANKWVQFSGEKEHFSAKLDLNICSQLKKISSNVIITAEEMAWINSPEHVQEIKQAFDDIFDDIKIIMYLRRQDRHFISHFQQGYKYLHSTARTFYGDHLLDEIKHSPYYANYLNYYDKVRLWADSFGKDNIVVRVFEREKLVARDIVTDFYYHCGLDKSLVTAISTNEAFSLHRQVINRALFNFAEPSWYSFKKLNWQRPKSERLNRPIGLDSKLSENIMRMYDLSNSQLAQYLGLDGALFSQDDQQFLKSHDNSISVEDASEILGSVLNTFHSMSIARFSYLKYKKYKRKLYDRIKETINSNSH